MRHENCSPVSPATGIVTLVACLAALIWPLVSGDDWTHGRGGRRGKR
jgi:hypothetical protein